MKKLFSLALVVALVIAMAITASAAVTTNGGTAQGDVNAEYVINELGDTYAVEVAFGSMEFTYTVTEAWDDVNHEVTSTAAWTYTAESNEIDVANDSNVTITATAAFAADTGYEAVEATFANNGAQFATAASGTITLTLDGELPASTDGKIGTITVTIAKYVPAEG